VTNRGYARGMSDLAVAFPAGREEDAQIANERGRIYRQHLDDLTDAAFAYAVSQAIARERWFPTVAALREYAAGAPPPAGALPAPRSPEAIEASREEARANARGGLEIIRRELEAKGVPVPAVLVRSMPASTGEEV
jgi:hypothetical protein